MVLFKVSHALIFNGHKALYFKFLGVDCHVFKHCLIYAIVSVGETCAFLLIFLYKVLMSIHNACDGPYLQVLILYSKTGIF